MTKISKTKRVLAEMLKESHWTDKSIDFEKLSRSVVEFRAYTYCGNVESDITVTHNIYHWLESRLDFCPEMDKLFHGRYVKEKNSSDWYVLLDEFPEWLKTLKDRSRQPKYENVTDYYGEGDPVQRDTDGDNNSCLSQGVNYLYFEIEDRNYVGLVVGGRYIKPRFFEVNDSCSELPMFDNARASMYCSKDEYHPTALAIKQKQEDNSQLLLPGFNKPIGIAFEEFHSWDSEDGGCSWDENDSYHTGVRGLEKYPVKDLDGDAEEDEEGNVIEQDIWEPGKLCIKDDVGYCPICGGKLESSFY